MTKEIAGWHKTTDGKSLERSYVLKNFVEAVAFINQIKDLAEAMNHHPDLHLTSYKNLKIVLSTHSVGGLSDNDFNLAAKINQLKG